MTICLQIKKTHDQTGTISKSNLKFSLFNNRYTLTSIDRIVPFVFSTFSIIRKCFRYFLFSIFKSLEFHDQFSFSEGVVPFLYFALLLFFLLVRMYADLKKTQENEPNQTISKFFMDRKSN